MSGTMTWAGGNQLVLNALAKKLVNRDVFLTPLEQAGLDQFFAAPGAGASGFPEAATGDVNGWNSLCRSNWFNGRFLTAEALRRQDTYFDYRTRLDAQALMPGVAYGLGLEATGSNATPYNTELNPQTGGFPVNREITLLPGLAFDMIGRPILVPASFRFRLEQLIALQRAKPRRVVGSGTEFAPCICLAPDPEGPSGGAPAVRPGPYLLVIEAAERPSGDAKVYGDVCGGSQPVTCQADAWCAGFGLSLVRFPVEVPESERISTAWDLRGVLSAYFLDVFEHSLIKRWDPTFATDRGFCIGAGPGRHDSGAVALAMVYLGTDGTAVFIDQWIPRRSIVATPGEDWHRTRFGAPPRAASWARLHQFQCMLAESLAAAPVVNAQGGFDNLNLLARGFRHIPPIGFLPISPAASRRMTNPQDPNTGDRALDAILHRGGANSGIVSGYVVAAREQAATYFRGTNVLTWCVVALHDDDILEDLANVFDKDPVQIDRPPRLLHGGGALGGLAPQAGFSRGTATGSGTNAALAQLLNLMLRLGMEHWVNRSVELVKLVVPLQGLVRRHPVLGVVPEDAQDQAADWGALPAQPASAAFDTAGLRQQLGLAMLPRHFVVYVKQRMVLLDALFILLELFQFVLRLAAESQQNRPQPGGTSTVGGGTAGTGTRPMTFASTAQMRAQWQATPAEKRLVAEAALAHPSVQLALTRGLPLAAPDLAVTGRATSFQAHVEAQDRALATAIPDAAERRQAAVDRVADSYAASHPDFQLVQLIAAVQPPAQSEAMVRAIGNGASVAGALGVAPRTTAADDAAKGGPPIFTTPDAARLYGELRTATDEKPAADLVRGAPAGVTVGEVLAKSPEEATVLLGGAENYTKFRTAYAAQATRSAEAAETVVSTPPPAGVGERLTTALRETNDPARAVETARAQPGGDAATKRFLDRAAIVVSTLGPARADVARNLFTLNRRG